MKKTVVYSLALIFLLSFRSICSHKNGDYFKVFRTIAYNEYSILCGVKNTDTVLFVAKSNLLKDCRYKDVKYIDKNGLKEISYLPSEDTLYFNYKTKDVNQTQDVIVGAYAPGAVKKTMYSFSGFPYFIDSCNCLKPGSH